MNEKQKQREAREMLVKLKEEIAHFKMMQQQLEKREKKLTGKISELKAECQDNGENIEEASQILLDLNKKNLKKTYLLEDMQLEYDMLAASEQPGSLFLTANASKGSLHRGKSQSQFAEDRQSYASIARSAAGQNQINQVIQDKIDNVLEQPRSKVVQQGRIQPKQRIVTEYPEVDMGRLSAEQKTVIEAQIQEIKAL